MAYLSGGEGGLGAEPGIIAALEVMTSDYLAWIDDVENQVEGFEHALRKAAISNLVNCRACHSRMLEGISILRSTPDAMLAFRLMNRAMLVQQFHSSLPFRKLDSEMPLPPEGYHDLPHGRGNWRPFQLAFILMNIAGMSLPDHDDRHLVDLIWFPTGGGKTEAYLRCRPMRSGRVSVGRLFGSAVDIAACPNLTDIRR